MTKQTLTKPRHFDIEPLGDCLVFAWYPNAEALTEDAAHTEQEALVARFKQSTARHAVVDLRALDYFGSSMIELLVTVWKAAGSRGGKFAVCGLSEVGREVLQTANFHTIWLITEDADQAIEALAA